MFPSDYPVAQALSLAAIPSIDRLQVPRLPEDHRVLSPGLSVPVVPRVPGGGAMVLPLALLFLLMNHHLNAVAILQPTQQSCRSLEFDHFVIGGANPQEL